MDFLIQEPFTLMFRIFIAAVFGGILGFERDTHGRGAGFRTHILVSAGSALFMILSTHISMFGILTPLGFGTITDPGRIAAQIVTGIGFLGTGVILKDGFSIRGLTTAACLWITAAIGMTVGAGAYGLAIFTTIIALFSLMILRRVDGLYSKDYYKTIELEVCNDVKNELITSTIKDIGFVVKEFDLMKDYETDIKTIKMSLKISQKGNNIDKKFQAFIKQIENEGINLKSVKWF